MPRPWPFVTVSTTPRQKNWVPMVATSEGTPNLTTINPFNQPANKPASRQAMKPSSTLPVVTNTTSKAVIPQAMTDGKDKSISLAITTSVKGIATIPKKGVVVMNAL